MSKQLSRPNLLILHNKWDLSIGEYEPEKVRQEHTKAATTFLSEELKVVDSKTALKKVFFVSAKEVMTVRMRQQKKESDTGTCNIILPSSTCECICVRCVLGRGLQEGYSGRLMEFEKFEQHFKQCLSSSAIRTKFEQHHSRGAEIIFELEQLLQSEEDLLAQRRYAVAMATMNNTSLRTPLKSGHLYIQNLCIKSTPEIRKLLKLGHLLWSQWCPE